MVGGLAAALLPAVKKAGAVWFGSSGNTRHIKAGASPLVQVEAYGRGAIATVDLPEQHYTGFYEGYANSALWPLLHSRADLSRGSPRDYQAYCAVNAYMARALTAFGGANSTFWIHDYHFLPLARELRKLGVSAKIGFFLHTPWPNPHVIALLPQCRELIEAMLAYDLIGFQTDEHRDNFADILRDLRIPRTGLTFTSVYGTCRLATFPIGIDTQEFADNAQEACNDEGVRRLCASTVGMRLIIGVDRLDYSKGLLQRAKAFDSLLTRYPGFKRHLSLLQIAVPSRSTIDIYRHLQCELAGLVGEINGKHGEIDWTPIRYLNKGFAQSTLAGFYRAASIGLVTPLQDGMNLVAKEYVAAQDPANPGVLVLSKFAGAARELDGALLVDPHDIEAVSRQIAVALAMPKDQRRARWQHMMDGLLHRSIHAWFSNFTHELKSAERKNIFTLAPTEIPMLPSSVSKATVVAGP
ncbi:MAG: trehalose-6-phosphate synthase [Deltaproteobacteria bacterium]|nr:trehalose-6-phosphate synthase [Deltaproteobacteria bacterium]